MLSGTILWDALGKRSAWLVLSVLLEPPFVPHQQSEIARALGLPEASVQRGLKALMSADLVQRKRRQYIASVGQDAIRYLWLLRQVERYRALPAPLVNGLSTIRERELDPDDCVIVFGSWARGVAVPGESDVDVATFTCREAVSPRRVFAGSYRFELHPFAMSELTQPRASAALDALVNGISVTRREAVFDALLNLRSFPKAFLIYRLDQARSFLDKAAPLRGAPEGADAAQFYCGLADRAVGQVSNILLHGRTMSWRETPRVESLDAVIGELHARLAREGDYIWLT